MKFLRTWSTISNNLPVTLQNACISYKKWKKYSKNPPNNIINLLELECKKVDQIFKKYYHNLYYPLCFSKQQSKEDIQQFADLNKTCIYKICKRLDKRIIPCPSTIEWLTKIKNSFKFAFLGGIEVTSLTITIPSECPICLEEVEKIIISKCGHYVCFDCLIKMYELNGVKGEMHNLIHYGDYCRKLNCPICRIQRPFSSCKIWPQVKS